MSEYDSDTDIFDTNIQFQVTGQPSATGQPPAGLHSDDSRSDQSTPQAEAQDQQPGASVTSSQSTQPPSGWSPEVIEVFSVAT